MKKTFAILVCCCAALAAFATNTTNYPTTNNFGAGEWFLVSSPSRQTNFNVPGNYVAKASDLTTVSNLVVSGGSASNYWSAASGGYNGIEWTTVNPSTRSEERLVG